MSKSELRKIIYADVDEHGYFLYATLSDNALRMIDINLVELGYRREDTAVAATVDTERITVTLFDGRIISIPLSWYPKLQELSPSELNNFSIYPTGIYWEEQKVRATVLQMLVGKED